jgi:hypothetical protein
LQADIEAESLCEGMDLRQRVSRARFEDLASDQWQLVDATLAKALAAAGLEASEVDRVVLAGGASRVPKLLSRLEATGLSEASLAKALAVEPDEGSALGAAAQAARLVSGPKGADSARDYKKGKDKLHKRVPAEAASVACLGPGLAVRVGAAVLPLLPAGCPLPVVSHRLAIPASAVSEAAAAASGVVVELGEATAGAEMLDLLATLPMAGMPSSGAISLLATVSVSAEGEVTFKVGAVLNPKAPEKTALDVAVTIPAP